MRTISKNNVIQICLMIFLGIVILLTDIVSGFASYVSASELNLNKQDIITSNSKVIFDSYFLNENGEKDHYMKMDIESESELFFRVKTRDNISLENIKLKLEYPNFKIVELNSPYVKEMNEEENEVYLNSISSNSEIVLSAKISFDEDKQDISVFNRVVGINFEADVYDEEEKIDTATSKIELNIAYTQNVEFVATNSFEQFFVNDDKIVLIEKIAQDLSNVRIPKSSDNLEIELPVLNETIPEVKDVIYNGKKIETVEIEENILKVENNEITISENPTYTIVYTYPKDILLEQKEIVNNVKMKTRFSNVEDIFEKEISTSQTIVPNGNNVSIETNIEQDIYNGYFKYDNDNYLNIVEKNIVTVSVLENMNNIKIDSNNYQYMNNGVLVETKVGITGIEIKKIDLDNILGEDGSILIVKQDGTLAGKIDNETELKDQKFVLNFDEVDNVILQTSKPVSIGSFEIKLNKKLYTTNDITSIEINSSVESEEIKNTSKTSVTLQNSTSQIEFDSNRRNIAQGIENTLELNTKLLASSQDTVIYDNPIIEYIFPKDLAKIQIDEIEIQSEDIVMENSEVTQTEENTILTITTSGTMPRYLSEEQKGIDVNVKLTVEADEKALTSENVVVNKVTNIKTGEVVEVEKEFNITNYNDFVLENTISDETETFTYVGEDETNEYKVERNSPSKIVNIHQEVKSNLEGENEIVVIGYIGTDSKIVDSEEDESNMRNELVEDIKTSLEDGTVYYTENEYATENLEDEENGWVETVVDNKQVKKFLIKTSLEFGQYFDIDYSLEIPENLDFNQSGFVKYVVMRDETTTHSKEIEMTSGKSAKLDGNVEFKKADESLNSNDIISQNDVLDLNIDVKNIGELVSEENTVEFENKYYNIVSSNVDYEENDGVVKISLEDLDAKQGSNINFQLKVRDGIEDDTQIFTNVKISNSVQSMNSELASVTYANTNTGFEISHEKYTGYGDELEKNLFLSQGTKIYTTVKIVNNTDTVYNNIVIEVNNDSAIFEDAKIIQKSDANGVIAEQDMKELTIENNRVTVNGVGKGQYEVYLGNRIKPDAEGGETYLTAKAFVNNEEIALEKLKFNIKDLANFSVSMTCENANTTLKAGDKIVYKIKMRNDNDDITGIDDGTGNLVYGHIIRLVDELPQELSVEKVKLNNEDFNVDYKTTVQAVTDSSATYDQDLHKYPYGLVKVNNVQVQCIMGLHEEVEIEIEAVVNKNVNIEDKKLIENTATMYYNTQSSRTSNIISHYVERYLEITQDTLFVNELVTKETQTSSGNTQTIPGVTSNPSNITSSSNASSGSTTVKAKYQVGGTVFIDANNDGMFLNEKAKASVKIELRDEANNVIQTKTTNSSGVYTFTSVAQGKYKLVATLPSGYEASKINSDSAGNKYTSAGDGLATATITVDGNKTVNLGIVQTKSFIPTISKTIKKITVVNAKGTFNYTYTNKELAKVELDSNLIENSQVLITFNINVTNTGDKEGIIEKIEDILPQDLVVKSELNPGWSYKDNVATYSGISKTSLKAGESKDIELVCTKEVSKNNIGTITNTANIKAVNNDNGTVTDTAKVILGIKTGEADYMVQVSLVFIIVVLGYITYINKMEFKLTREEKKKWNKILKR